MRLKNPLPPLPPIEGPAWREYGLLGLLLAAVFLACLKPMADPDTFWHLAVGREMWQTHALVRTETFSFTDAGAPWTDTEWLFHACVYPLYRATGETGLRIITALAGMLGAVLSYRCVRLMGAGATELALYGLLMLGAYSDRVRCRPDALSIVLMAILCEILIRWHRHLPAWGPHGWGVVLLFFVWVQVHGAWTYGLLLLGTFIAGALLDAWRAGRLCASWVVGLLGPMFASVAVLFLNPFGWRLPLFPLQAFASFFSPGFVRIAEWGRTPFLGIYALFSVGVLGTVAAILLLMRRFSWSEFLPAAGQAFLGLYWVRYTAFAALALAPSASSRLRLLPLRPALRRVLYAVAVLAAMASIGVQTSRLRQPYDLAARYPVQECAFLKAHLPGANLFHEFRVGGYLEWVMPGSFRVFMDGRFPLFKQAAMDYYEAHRTPQTYRAFLARYPIDAALYAYPGFQLVPPTGGPPRGPSAILFPKELWALVDFGPYGMVLLKREAANEEAIKTCEYSVLRPDDLSYLLWAAVRGQISRDALAADIHRCLAHGCPPDLRAAFRAALEQLQSGQGSTHAS